MVMTDGVADDYFPNEPNMLELYGDLVLNQVIEIAKPNKTDLTQNLLETSLRSIAFVAVAATGFQPPSSSLCRILQRQSDSCSRDRRDTARDARHYHDSASA